MTSLFKIFFVFQMLFLFFFNQLVANGYEAYDEQDFEHILFGYCNMSNADLRYAPLNGIVFPYRLNLYNSYLRCASFNGSVFTKADLSNVNAIWASFRNVRFGGSNLSYGNFSGALFWGADLTNVMVKGASFYRAKGLTNEQKQYLRENGAINVPLDIVYELEDYDKEVFDPNILSFKEKIKRYFTKKFKWHFGSKNQGTQKFEEDFEEFLKDVSYPDENLSLKEKIKRFFYRKYELRFKRKHQETQTEEIAIQTD